MRCDTGSSIGKRDAAAQLEELRARVAREARGVRDERDDGVGGAERPAVVEEGHGHEEVSEENALHAHERQHAGERAGVVVAPRGRCTRGRRRAPSPRASRTDESE